MNLTKVIPGGQLWGPPQRSDPQEGPTARKYKDILCQALWQEFESSRTADLERPNMDLADIR